MIPPLRESLLLSTLKGSWPSCIRKTVWAQLNFLSLELVAIPIITIEHHHKKPLQSLLHVALSLWGTGSGPIRPFYQAIISGIIFRDPPRSDGSRGGMERAQQPITRATEVPRTVSSQSSEQCAAAVSLWQPQRPAALPR